MCATSRANFSTAAETTARPFRRASISGAHSQYIIIDRADLAYSGGYFDQAHFANDFRAFSGFRPSAYLRKAGGEYGSFIPVDERR